MSVQQQHNVTDPPPGPQDPAIPHGRDTISDLSVAEHAHAEGARLLETALSLLCDALTAAAEPAKRNVLTLTQAAPMVRDQRGAVSSSFSVRNMGTVQIYVSVDEALPRSGTGAIPVAAGQVVTIPNRVQDIVVGVDPAQQASIPFPGGMQVEVQRYSWPQPAA